MWYVFNEINTSSSVQLTADPRCREPAMRLPTGSTSTAMTSLWTCCVNESPTFLRSIHRMLKWGLSVAVSRAYEINLFHFLSKLATSKHSHLFSHWATYGCVWRTGVSDSAASKCVVLFHLSFPSQSVCTAQWCLGMGDPLLIGISVWVNVTVKTNTLCLCLCVESTIMLVQILWLFYQSTVVPCIIVVALNHDVYDGE